MDTLIIDVGCSNTKFHIFGESPESYVSPTPVIVSDLVHYVLTQYNRIMEKHQISAAMVISFSDAVICEHKDGKKTLHGVFEDGVLGDVLPSRGSHFQSIVSELHSIHRVLPVSTYLMSRLAGLADWNLWDYTHASNSGYWDFDKGGWRNLAQLFIAEGVINKKVLSPKTLVTSTPVRWYLGGHDSVFAVGNDPYYSPSPYLSLGTWVTASVPCEIETTELGERTVLGANGVMLRQICFKSDIDVSVALAQALNFFESNMLSNITHKPIKVFGVWSEEVSVLQGHNYLKFEFVETETRDYIQREALQCVS